MNACRVTSTIFACFVIMTAPEGAPGYDGGLWPELPGKEVCTTCGDESRQDAVPRVTVEGLMKMIETGADVVILDAQPKDVYDKGHIKGALSFPWAADPKQSEVEKLPRDKIIVIYCDCGPDEADSADLAGKLLERGFTKVRVLADPSIRGWIRAGYPIDK